jgi:hypothetical protein
MKIMVLLCAFLLVTSSALAHPVETDQTDTKAGNKYWTGSKWVGQDEYDKAEETFRRFNVPDNAGDLSDEIVYPPDPSKWMPSEHNK